MLLLILLLYSYLSSSLLNNQLEQQPFEIACLVSPPHIMSNAPSFTLGGKSIVPFQYAFSTHGHNLSVAFRQHHSKCAFDTWCFLWQGLLRRNDVKDIITVKKDAG
jgi:hypothetical protein